MADSPEPMTAAAELGVGAYPGDVTTDYSEMLLMLELLMILKITLNVFCLHCLSFFVRFENNMIFYDV